MSDPLAFESILREGDAHHAAAIDVCRAKVQQFFDELTLPQKRVISMLLTSAYEWDAHAALSTAAGDWVHSQQVAAVAA